MRGPFYERRFLDEVESEASRRYNIDARGYRERVEARLAVGAERYGDDDFMGKDVVTELLEETPDVAAYALLEAQKTLADPNDDGDRVHWLFEAAVAAAYADHCARMARSRAIVA